MVGVEEGREFRFRGDLYSQESTFPLVIMYFFCEAETPKLYFQVGLMKCHSMHVALTDFNMQH